MRIYLAARYSRREELCGYRAELKALGHQVTSRWLNGSHQIADSGKPIGDDGEALVEDGSSHCAAQLREHFAQEDVADVLAADILVAFTEIPRSGHSRGGRHVEFGIALGTGKPVIVVGPRENVFCWLPQIGQYESFKDMLADSLFSPRNIPLSLDAVASGGHSNHHLVACPACGDIDGCHLPARMETQNGTSEAVVRENRTTESGVES